MKTLRSNVFETNSSSCHSFTMISEEDFEQLKTLDYVLVNFNRDICEHESFIESVDHINIKTPKEAAEMFRSQVESFSGEVPDYYVEYVAFMKENWGEELVRYILFDDSKEIQEKLSNYKFSNEYGPDDYELREIMHDYFNVSIESYSTLFDGDSEIEELKELTSPSGDKIYLFDVSVSC